MKQFIPEVTLLSGCLHWQVYPQPGQFANYIVMDIESSKPVVCYELYDILGYVTTLQTMKIVAP